MFLHVERCRLEGTPAPEITPRPRRCQRKVRFALSGERPSATAYAARRTLAAVLVQLVAPRLQAAAYVPVHLGLRQREAGLGGHLRDDLHVVVGPGHGLRAPFL